jgi:polyribonucleotide nucleotidyltransferase
MTVAGTREAIVMVEGGADELPESVVLRALQDAHQALQACIDLQLDLKERAGKDPMPLTPIEVDTELRQRLQEMAQERLRQVLSIPGKQEREEAMSALEHDVLEALLGDAIGTPEAAERTAAIGEFMHEMESVEMRRRIIRDGKRADGRGTADIRPISGRTGLLPRSHGSVLFTRGETQALVVATLGTQDDEQMIDGLEGKSYRRFMLHYNFPPYSVGEVRPLRGPGRREIGHGALAERAILPVIPAKDSLPYTIRIVSEIMESNGSSSMATVCGSSLALMDAGVAIKAPVAGIAMGLIEQDGEVAILSDILGLEDHLGDMDFKVAGTTEGITAIQMDIKTIGVSSDIMAQALEQARQGRLHILQCMEEILQAPRMELSTHAPRILTLKVQRDKVRDIIGPGGKIIKGIVEKTGVNIDVKDDGSVVIAAANEAAAQAASRIVQELTQEAEIGRIYQGRVRKIMDFGAFVEIFPGTDGLLHISQISDKRVNKVTDELQEGDNVLVKVLDVDQNGRIKLSHKEAVREREAAEIR